MNKLEELIQQYCPDGVEYRPLEQCCNILDNLRKPITKALRVAGNYPYYGANGIQDYVEGYIFDGTFVLVGEDGSVQTADGRPVVTWAEGKIWVNNHAHIISEVADVNLRYIFHYLQTMNIAHLIHGNIPKLTGGDFKVLEIPVPPLPVQEEIVRILDKFTELEQELEQELELRKKQYEYYRDKMLSLSDYDGEVEEVSLGNKELFRIFRGVVLSKDYIRQHEGDYPVYSSQTLNNGELGKIDTYAFDGECITWTTDGANAGTTFYRSGKFNITNVCGAVEVLDKTKIDTRYLSYVSENLFYKYVNYNSPNPKLMSNVVATIIVPIPDMNKQKQIVSLLDKFNMLVSDISEGLPAEIKMRYQQYEYYRDKLLNFKRLEVV